MTFAVPGDYRGDQEAAGWLGDRLMDRLVADATLIDPTVSSHAGPDLLWFAVEAYVMSHDALPAAVAAAFDDGWPF